MDWGALLRPESLPEYVAATGMLALAAWLVALDHRSATNVGFATFLATRAASMYTFTWQSLSTTAADALFWEPYRVTFVLLSVYALLFFLALYPRRRAGLPSAAAAAAVLGGAALLTELVYVVRPGLWATYRIAETGQLQQDTVGPLFSFQVLRVLLPGAVALLLALDWTRTRPGPAASSLILVAVAFAVHAVFDGTQAIQLALTVPLAGLGAAPRLQIGGAMGGLAFVATAVLALVAHAARARSWGRGPTVRRFLGALALPALTNLFVFALVALGIERPQGPTALFFLGFWRLSLPLLVTYALVKHRLFGLDVRVKRTVQRAVVALVFVLLFFAVSEGAEAIFEVRAGPLVGIIVAALLAFGLTPVQRLGERVADAAMPDVRSIAEMSPHERRALYRALANSALASGRVSADERRLLRVARARLGLSTLEAKAVENEALDRIARREELPRRPRSK